MNEIYKVLTESINKENYENSSIMNSYDLLNPSIIKNNDNISLLNKKEDNHDVKDSRDASISKKSVTESIKEINESPSSSCEKRSERITSESCDESSNKENNIETENYSKVNQTQQPPINNKIINEIDQLLLDREEEKLKINKRRQSMTFKRKTMEYRKKNSIINPVAITQIMSKANSKTDYEKYKIYMKYIDVMIAITVCVNIAVSIIDNEIYITYSGEYIDNYMNVNNYTKINENILKTMGDRVITAEENTLRFINIIVVLSNLFFIYLHYFFKIRLLRSDKKLSEYDNLYTSGLFKYFLIEVIICAIFYPPYLNIIISGSMLNDLFVYNLNAIFSFLVLIKCYIILRVYSYFSMWTSDTANSICRKYKARGGINFAVKAELKKRPYTMLTIMMVISMLLCAFAIRTFEYGVTNDSNSSLKGTNDLQSLANCFWLVIITMMTVGYGDLYPKSHFGRGIGVIACIIGMLLISLIVVSLTVVTNFTNEERRAYSTLKRLQADDSALNKAAFVLCDIVRLRKLILKNKESNKNKMIERFVILAQLKRNISIFKNDYRIASSFSLPIDEMLTFLEDKLKRDVQLLILNIKKISKVEDELMLISKDQEYVKRKLDLIIDRQEEIANYILDVNNRNYLKCMTEKFKDFYKKKFKNLNSINSRSLKSSKTSNRTSRSKSFSNTSH